MISLNDFKRLIAPLQRKIYLIIGRAVLTAVNNSEGTQKLSMEVLKNEIITDVEKPEDYGFTSFPLKGAELLPLFFNGNRDHGMVVKAHDRRHRPKDLVEGEVAIFTDEHVNQGGHRIHFKRGQLIDILMKTLNLTADDGAGGIGDANFKNTHFNVEDGDIVVSLGDIIVSAGDILVSTGGISLTLGNMTALAGSVGDSNSTTTTMQDMRDLYNSHTHPGDSGGTTGVPNQTMG